MLKGKQFFRNMFAIAVASFMTLSSVTSCYGWLIYHKPVLSGKVIDAESKEPIVGALVVVTYNKRPILGGPGGSWTTVIDIREGYTDHNGEYFFPSYNTLIHPLSKKGRVDVSIYKYGYKILPEFTVEAFPEGLVFSPLPEGFLLRLDQRWKKDFEKYLLTLPEKERSHYQSGGVKYKDFLALLPVRNPKERLRKLDVPFLKVTDDLDLDVFKYVGRKELYTGDICEKTQFTLYGLSKAKDRKEMLQNIPSLPPDRLNLLQKQQNLIRLINEERENLESVRE